MNPRRGPKTAALRDILNFAIAICEYVFVLSARYDAYQQRKGTEQASSPKK